MFNPLINIPESDLSQLICEKTVMIGNTPVVIKPITLVNLPSLGPQVQRFMELLKKEGITADNYSDNYSAIVETLIGEAISLYEKLSGINRESLVRLPAVIHTEIIEAIIHVNITSHEGFSKNWVALTNTLKRARVMFSAK